MMGGLWGVRDGFLRWIEPYLDNMLESLKDGSGRKGLDQDFLNCKVYVYALGLIDESCNILDEKTLEVILARNTGKWIPNMLSHDDIAFGNLRFPDNTRLPHVNEEMRRMIIPRKYGDSYNSCIHCGMKHDNTYIGKVESLSSEECVYLNLTQQEMEEREQILSSYKKYNLYQYKYGFSPVQHEHGSEKIT